MLSYSAVSDSFAMLWTVACEASLSMGFPMLEHWSGLPFPSLGDRTDPGIDWIPANAQVITNLSILAHVSLQNEFS